ncbi:polyadenylate-binding protein-interacting protein 2B-like isoform 8-T12 [Salvelinus alpinus]
MSGPEVAKTPGKEGMEAVANGHAGEGEQAGDDPFAEYMWMENEDAYNRQVEEEFLEQEFLERCFQEMLDEEDQDWFIPARDLPSGLGQIQQQLNGLSVSDRGNAEEMAGLPVQSQWAAPVSTIPPPQRVTSRLVERDVWARLSGRKP